MRRNLFRLIAWGAIGTVAGTIIGGFCFSLVPLAMNVPPGLGPHAETILIETFPARLAAQMHIGACAGLFFGVFFSLLPDPFRRREATPAREREVSVPLLNPRPRQP